MVQRGAAAAAASTTPTAAQPPLSAAPPSPSSPSSGWPRSSSDRLPSTYSSTCQAVQVLHNNGKAARVGDVQYVRRQAGHPGGPAVRTSGDRRPARPGPTNASA